MLSVINIAITLGTGSSRNLRIEFFALIKAISIISLYRLYFVVLKLFLLNSFCKSFNCSFFIKAHLVQLL